KYRYQSTFAQLGGDEATGMPVCTVHCHLIVQRATSQGLSSQCGNEVTACHAQFVTVMLSLLQHAFELLLQGRLLCRPTFGQTRPPRCSCHASSTTCKEPSAGSPPASPPIPPDARARSCRDSSKWSPSLRRRGC